MHYFVAEIRQQEIGSVGIFSKHAQDLYDENLDIYSLLRHTSQPPAICTARKSRL